MRIKGKRLLIIIGSLVLLCGCEKREGMYFFTEHTEDMVNAESEERVSAVSDKIIIYVCGQVNEPGVVETDADARVVEAISLAGGMTKDAAQNYINLAGKLTDGDMIYVPTQEEVTRWEADAQKDEMININTANEQELCTLPGIGESKAAEIVIYRKKNGDFQTKEDLMKVSGIKQNLYEKIADKITVD